MTISVGDKLPEATLLHIGADGPAKVSLGDLSKGRKLVLFGLPGAYTGTCTTAHVPSFIRTKAGFDEKGVDDIVCMSVNDPFVMKAWGESTGASKTGILMMSDADGSVTRSIGLSFDAPDTGLLGRCRRFALYAEDGVVKVMHIEEKRGVCEVSGGEAMLEAI